MKREKAQAQVQVLEKKEMQERKPLPNRKTSVCETENVKRYLE